MLKNKRSQIHIEMIMSFVLFVGFIVAILLFLNPVKEQKTSTLSLDLAQEKIMSNISIGYSTVALVIKEGISITKSCFIITNPIPASNDIFVKDQNGNILSSKAEGGKIYIQTSVDSRFYNLYFSNVFTKSPLLDSDCQELLPENYSLGALSVQSSVLYENLQRLNDLYNLNYVSLKKELAIQNDFDFRVYDFDKNSLMERTSPRNFGTSLVLAREIVLNAVDLNDNKKEAMISLRVA